MGESFGRVFQKSADFFELFFGVIGGLGRMWG
jgi:hypothetical protein